jgi:hypothetical protein
MYYIKNIKLLSGTDTLSVLELTSGLNVIYGPSNTGKSLVLDCIDFMFGGDAKRLYKPALKLKSIIMSLDVDGNTVTLSRKLYKDKDKVCKDIEVSGANDIANGTYRAGAATKKYPSINTFWLHMMGIDDAVKIIAKVDSTPNNLTVRTFIHTFLINETRMVGENSILKSGQGYSKNIPIPTISSLIYLATGKTFITQDMNPATRGAIIKAKRVATKRLVDLSINALKEENVTSLPQPQDGRTVGQLQEAIEILMEEISGTEESLENATNRSRDLANKLLETENHIAESSMLKNRYDSLRTQYEADIKRLTFIAEGDMKKGSVPKVERCPFCDGELDVGHDESCVEAAIAEVEKIERQIKDLQLADEALDAEIVSLNQTREKLLAQRAEVQTYIRGELKPRISALKKEFADYTAALEHAKAAELVETFNRVLLEQLDQVNEEDEDTETADKFDVRAKIKEYLSESLNKHLSEILRECKYENYIGTRFDEEICDVIVNGSEKMSQGKGFRAFLNTVLAMAVQEMLQDYDLYQPHLLVVDSPILSLKEREEQIGTEVTSEKMRSSLFEFMISHSSNRQTIVLENEIPKADYSSAHLIHFTKVEGDGTYGLIKGYRD